MSQEDIRMLLSELEDQATVGELSELAQEKFPDRTPHMYLSKRLQLMEKKGLVKKSMIKEWPGSLLRKGV